ncbi:MAG: carboxymuconolactone decarboxylase family protein [Candidatus Hodarchaeales archaeon]|jgi:AhpD family alkylhydroperoxidase
MKSQNEINQFKKERDELNEVVMKYAGKSIKRFWNIDTRVYDEGALPKKVKELLGLVASLVLRCDDCILYHLIQSHQAKLTDQELEEALAIGLVVGGSITIPHLRRAFKAWKELKIGKNSSGGK